MSTVYALQAHAVLDSGMHSSYSPQLPRRALLSPSIAAVKSQVTRYTGLQADAVLHFGTHGSLEFMPGKQVGMSGICYPDSLIGSIPNIYYYAANNPSEATIAKRRSYANTISYLTPPAENAGLYKGLKVGCKLCCLQRFELDCML